VKRREETEPGLVWPGSAKANSVSSLPRAAQPSACVALGFLHCVPIGVWAVFVGQNEAVSCLPDSGRDPAAMPISALVPSSGSCSGPCAAPCVNGAGAGDDVEVDAGQGGGGCMGVRGMEMSLSGR
jgi:hypothetical protein